MSKPTLVVFPDILKSHIDTFTRKDGSVVQAHDDKRVAAPKPAAGGHSTSTLNVLADQHAGEASRHDKLATKKGVGHPDYDHHVVASSGHTRLQYHAEHARDAADGSAERASYLAEHARIKPKVEAIEAKISGGKPEPKQALPAREAAAKPPAEFGVHHSKLKEGDHLFDKHGQKVDEVEGFSRGVNSAKVHARAGYTHGTRSDGFLPGLSNKKPGAAPAKEPRLALPKKKKVEAPQDGGDMGAHKVGDTVSYAGERGATRTGKVKGSRDGKVIVEHKAGYTEAKHHSELKAAAAKTGSAAPAKMMNAGSEKWPMHVKSSEKLSAKHEDGSTHHVGGFKAPEYPAGGGATDGDTTLHHDGKVFSFTGKRAKNMKSGEDSYEYSHRDEKEGAEHRAFVTASGHMMND